MNKGIKKLRVCKNCGHTEEEVEFYSYMEKTCKECWLKKRRKYINKHNIDYLKSEEFKNKYSTPFEIAKCRLLINARKHVFALIKKGKIKRREECHCKMCGKKHSEISKIVFHHPSYKNFSEVVPLCSSCHKKLHKTLKVPTIYPRELFDNIKIPSKENIILN